MSSVGRSTSRGGKGAKLEASAASKPQKTDTKLESPKALDHNPKIQPTADQMRIAQIIDTEDPDLKDKIKQVMDATRKSEDEVCTALHDCDNDPDRAVNMLLEGAGTGEWETSVKKKKNRQPSTTKSESVVNNRDAEQEDWGQEREGNPERERTRTSGGGPPRMRGRGSLDNRGWRGRENKENEKNLEEGRDGYRRGGRMMNGPGRSGRGGRGGGRLGPRTFQSRDKGGFPRSIETWNNPGADDSSGDALKMEKWGDDFPSPEDWDNEEYTGSLADSKVFTPSGGAIEPITNSEVLPEPANPDLSSSLAAQNLSSSVASSSSQMSQSLELHQPPSQLSQSPVPVGVGPLSAAQSEYLSQFTQATENLKTAVGISTTTPTAMSYGTTNSYPVTSSTSYQPPSPPSGFTATSVYQPPSSPSSFTATSGECSPVRVPESAVGIGTTTPTVMSYGTTNSYPVASSMAYQTSSPPTGFMATSASFSSSNYVGTANSYSSQIQEPSMDNPSVTTQCSSQSMPPRTKTQRPRVPPPSKIPSTAVEMPGDAINSIGYLDVQFGGLEFGSESSFETTAEQTKYPSSVSGSVLDSLPSPRATSNLDLSGASQASALDTYTGTTTQKGSQQNMSSSLGQSQKLAGTEPMLAPAEHKTSQPSYATRGTSSATLDMDKSEVGLSYSTPSTASYQSSYQSQKSTGSTYQPTSSYSSNYSSPQVTSSATAYPSNQSQMSYTSSGTGSSYSSQAAAPSSYPSSSYSQASAGVTYQPGPASYAASSFPTASPAAAYQSTGAGQSVYSYSATGTAQYQNNYGGAATTVQNHTKLSSGLSSGTKEAQYDTTTTASSSLSNTSATTTNSGLSTNVNATPALGLASSSQTVNTTSTKVTSSTGKSGVVPNIPPGVPPMLGTQYIMSQGGLPYFQQPVYSYEDIQLLQQRIPHMAAGYYDMGFQAPTSLATGREGGLASVAYSMSDGRYTRADNNASPVPSTLSQQNAAQAHQQPMLNPTALPPGYAYFYGGGMMPGGFQYGTPAIYPMPPATNAHGSTSSTQYPKPGSYASGYGSGYDGLSQSQDYSKTGYVSGSQSQSKAGVGANAGTAGSSASDLGATMYGKSHVALGKVNSYEKQGFHSGTPPPFNLSGSQSTPMAPSGAYGPHVFIPALAAHQQHHSTTLMHQPLHQMEMRNPGRRSEAGSSSNQRSQSSTQPNKSGAKQGYSPSYWAPN